MSGYDEYMHNPLEEFIKKTIFLIALGFFISTTETYKKTVHLFEEDHKVFLETQNAFDKSVPPAQSDLLKNETKSSTR